MCFLLPCSVTARYRWGLHLPTWLSNLFCLENSLLCPLSVHRSSLALPKAFWFLVFTKGLVLGHCGGSGGSLGILGVSQPKRKCPLKQQEEKAFLCSQGQVLQATANVIKWIGILDVELLLGISSWVFPSRVPLVIGGRGIGERLITRGMKGKKVCYVKVRMADEIADLAKCFLLAVCS